MKVQIGIDAQRPSELSDEERYAAWFHELDAWTEYWDIYHPETRGLFYFGDAKGEPGLLARFLPRERRPPAFTAWTQMALLSETFETFADAVRVPDVTSAVLETDALVARLFAKYFGDPLDRSTHADYLEAIFRCATDTLPPAVERDSRVSDADWRKPTAGRHTIDSDLMWFCWALHLEASQVLSSSAGKERRALQLAGICMGCAVNFAWRGHRRTRPEYRRDNSTARLLRERGLLWATDFDGCAREIHALFRIREWGHT
jgi:hypothetical protein